MYSTKELNAITLHINNTPKLEIIKKFPILELIAKGGRMATIRAYTNPKGKDISSLKADIVHLDGCHIAQGASIMSFTYDIKEKCAKLRLDRSKILPIKVKGYILIKVSGNYSFEQILKLPWIVNKAIPQITEDWINIDINKIIAWKTGSIIVSKISFSLPQEIQDNLIWYEIPNVTFSLSGKGFENFNLQPQNDSTYNLYFNSHGTIDKPIQKKIKLLTCAYGIEVFEKEIMIDFEPAMRTIKSELVNFADEYELGAQNTQLAELKLSCISDDEKAIAKVSVSVECTDNLIECEDSQIEILANTSKIVKIKVIREKLTMLPTDDIPVEVVVKGINQYTTVSNFSSVFKLTK